jgi:hypothetical protein
MLPDNFPFYQFIAVTSLVPDLVYNDQWGKYKPIGERYDTAFTNSDCLPVNNRAAATQLIIKDLPAEKPEGYTLLVALGVSVGTLKGGAIKI